MGFEHFGKASGEATHDNLGSIDICGNCPFLLVKGGTAGSTNIITKWGGKFIHQTAYFTLLDSNDTLI